MARLVLLLLVIFTFVIPKAHSKALTPKVKLLISVERVKLVKGCLFVQLFKSEQLNEQWDKTEILQSKELTIEQKSLDLAFEDLTPGFYGVKVFQDLNGNNTLDVTDKGLPIEPVGFSRNPSLLSGEPTPQDVVLPVSQEEHIKIKLRHRKTNKKAQ